MQLTFKVFDLEQEASSSALKESEGLLTLNLFDEVVTPTAAARVRPGSSTRGGVDPLAEGMQALMEGGKLPEKERRFLGCLWIPLAAIYQAELLQGAFKVRW